MEIKIKYHTEMEPLCLVNGVSDWIDLRAAEDITMMPEQFALISLGVSMKLPDGYEAHIVPRSSTYKNFGIIQTNSMGVIDNSYCGENDVWKFPALAMRHTTIHKGDRIAQFRIMKKMEPVDFVVVDHMEDADRGGFGSTGIH